MSYNENVAEFLGSLGSFYEAVPQEDLQMAVGDIIERVSSRGSSPAHSTTSPSRQQNLSQAVAEEDDDEEEFKDSLVLSRSKMLFKLLNFSSQAKQDEEEVVQRTAAKSKLSILRNIHWINKFVLFRKWTRDSACRKCGATVYQDFHVEPQEFGSAGGRPAEGHHQTNAERF